MNLKCSALRKLNAIELANFSESMIFYLRIEGFNRDFRQTYNANNSSDWIDFQQLFYLADPSLLFVTEDKDFRNRTSGTTQSNQIVSFDQFFARMR
jgi:hypothetical protein